MRLLIILLLALPLIATPSNAKEPAQRFEIDFRCCGEYVNIWDPAYSNAVLRAIYPEFRKFTKKLDLPLPPISELENFLPEHVLKARGEIGGTAVFKNGFIIGFHRGYVDGFYSPGAFFLEQNPASLPKYFGTPRMTKEEAVELARKAIRKLGYSLEDILANYEPSFSPFLEHVGTNTIPRCRIEWLDPRSGAVPTRVDVDLERKTIEAIRFFGIVLLERPGPRIKVKPAPLPTEGPWAKLWRDFNDPKDINHEYAYRLVPVVFKAAEEWARKFNFNLPLPITTNHVQRFYCSNNGGVPYVEMTLKDGWYFVYRVNGITYAGSPRRFFESDALPFHVKNYVGKWNLTEAQAVELARKTVARFGDTNLHVNVEPRIRRPRNIGGLPTIPRLDIEWMYPPSPNDGISEWIEVEVDCDKGTVEMIHFDDVRLWDKPPDLGVAIEPDNKSPSSPRRD